MGNIFESVFTRATLYWALLVAWVAMLGSLYFSEIAGYLPCNLCWYQRILMYPLAGLLAIGLLRQDSHLPYLILPFSLLGQGIATYHYLLEKTDLFSAPLTCRTGVSCTTIWINWFGFITIAFLSMIAFFLITILCLVAITAGEPDAEQARSTPWGQVAGIIAVVIVAFYLLIQATAPSQALSFTVLPAGDMEPVSAPIPIAEADHTAAATAQEGAQLYLATCASCHGVEAEGIANLGPALVDSAVVDNPDDTAALAYIRAGVDLDNPDNKTGLVMPPSGGRPDLTDQEMLAIIHYLRAK
jgi:disulfide bond formation protein DsbB